MSSYIKIRLGTCVILVSVQLLTRNLLKRGINKASLFPSAERRFCKLLGNRCEGVVSSYYLHKLVCWVFLTAVWLVVLLGTTEDEY